MAPRRGRAPPIKQREGQGSKTDLCLALPSPFPCLQQLDHCRYWDSLWYSLFSRLAKHDLQGARRARFARCAAPAALRPLCPPRRPVQPAGVAAPSPGRPAQFSPAEARCSQWLNVS